jgi:hypothetical protein
MLQENKEVNRNDKRREFKGIGKDKIFKGGRRTQKIAGWPSINNQQSRSYEVYIS